MIASFSETSTVNFRKCVVKPSMRNLNSYKKHELLWSPSSVLANRKSVNFLRFFTSRVTNGG